MTVPSLPADLVLLHERGYAVDVYRRADDELLVRGTVRDGKPPGLYVEDDPDPLVIHEMTIDLRVAYPSLEIRDVEVWFGAHPQPGCPGIAAHYGSLVGTSIVRGFTHRVRELFGGPRGCTHVTALLQAMAPAVVQSTWSMRLLEARRPETAGEVRGVERSSVLGNLDTCHVWAADGDLAGRVARGERVPAPLTVRERLVALGRDPDRWSERP